MLEENLIVFMDKTIMPLVEEILLLEKIMMLLDRKTPLEEEITMLKDTKTKSLELKIPFGEN